VVGGGTDPARFYSVGGFAQLMLGLFPFLIYALVTSIALLRSR